MLQIAADWIAYSVLGLSSASRAGQSLDFFIYDSIKIMLLLFVMIAVIGFLRTYISQNKIKAWLSKTRLGMGNLAASVFGAITPFCSCSSIPIFISFLKSGVPLGITLSFLITSPIVNEYLVVLMLGFFGWKITALYVLSGILIGVLSGLIIGRMKLEKYLVKDMTASPGLKEVRYTGIKARISFGIQESVSIVRKLWLWVLVGVAVGAIVHNYVPEELIHSIVSSAGPFAVPIAVLIGIPMYGSCAAIVPIAVVLFQKGVPLGTALSFMMAVSALSLPEAIILRRAMKLKLIAIFFGIVALVIVFIGYLFNFLQGWLA